VLAATRHQPGGPGPGSRCCGCRRSAAAPGPPCRLP
jgi:hypothetical protein